MCGIIGYTGDRDAQPLLLSGLGALEYRGYDSAGLALQREDELQTVHAVGNLAALRERVPSAVGVAERPAVAGIGHTRWATHGRVTEANAHPHADTSGRLQVVVNGIVENHADLRRDLEAGGCVFTSETDAEVVAQLLGALYDGDLAEAARAAYPQLEGQFAFVAAVADEPGTLVAVRRAAPLVVGLGEGEQFIASAVSAFAEQTQQVVYLDDGEVAALRPDGLELDGAPYTGPVDEIEPGLEAADRAGYGSFMAKEIAEQGAAVARTLETVRLDTLPRDVTGVRILACGTSYHAGLVARYAIERWAGVPVNVEVASEFRYREPVARPGGLTLAISQSGETADTLAAMRLAREAGETVVAITNVETSQAAREADGVLLTGAGTEIGVAATKTFAAQLTALYMVGLALARRLDAGTRARLADDLRAMPAHLDATVARSEALARDLGVRFADAELFMFLGRDVGSAVAQEGALKLKEITYRPADAHAAGEMKHGPIALIGHGTPVLVDATTGPLREKLASNVEEVAARGAHVIAVCADGDERLDGLAADVFRVPRVDWLLAPLLSVVPWQLIALELAQARGLNVDQPRNLAKTVTVE